MAATRLSDSQKQELVSRFRGGASIQQLALHYGCSPTTVSRTAKAAMELADYEELLKLQKAQRGGTGPATTTPGEHLPVDVENDAVEESPSADAPLSPGDAETNERFENEIEDAGLTSAPAEPEGLVSLETTVGSYPREDSIEPLAQAPFPEAGGAAFVEVAPEPLAVPQRILGRRRRSGAAVIPPPAPLAEADVAAVELSAEASLATGLTDNREPVATLPANLSSATAPTEIATDAGTRQLAIDDADDFGADESDDDLINDDLSDDTADEIVLAQGETFVAIPVGPFIDDLVIHEAVPFNAAALPSSAFLLVDKTVELQARPLRELPELGRLAEDELDRQALVLFVNPRQAKRQCGRTQRVIPLPDPSLLERTAPYLVAQGITRLVIEGALYALPGG